MGVDGRTEDNKSGQPPGITPPTPVLVRCVSGALGVLMLSCIALTGVNIVARYVFMSPIHWAEEVIVFAMVWIVFVGAALVTWSDSHIRIDIADSLLPSRFQAVRQRLVLMLLGSVALLVITQSVVVVRLLIATDQRTSLSGLPVAILHVALPVGFFLMLVAAVWAIAGRRSS